MQRLRTVLLITVLAAIGAAPLAIAQTSPPASFGVTVDVLTLTNFGSYFSLPVGLRLSADYRLASIASGLSWTAGGQAGWWMESFRDTFHFHPELIPVMVPCAVSTSLRWDPIPALSLEVGAQVGVVLEFCPGAPPAVLLVLSPEVGLRWYLANRAGLELRMGWAWVGADPVWGGPSVRAGAVLR